MVVLRVLFFSFSSIFICNHPVLMPGSISAVLSAGVSFKKFGNQVQPGFGILYFLNFGFWCLFTFALMHSSISCLVFYFYFKVLCEQCDWTQIIRSSQLKL